MAIDVSIIIVNYNTLDLVLKTLESLGSNTMGLQYEIIVVDNNSNDDLSEISVLHPDISIIKLDENIGFGRANNIGVSRSTGRNLFFLNPDTIVKDNAVATLSNFLDFNKKVGACGANLFNADGKPTHSFKRVLPSVFSEISDAMGGLPIKLFYGKNYEFNYTGEPLKVAYICGADLMVKRSVFNQVGGFDKDIFMYYEDSLLCSRIASLGYTIMSVPQAEIIHLEGKSFILNVNREQRIFDGRKLFFKKVYSDHYVKFSNQLNKFLLSIASKLCRIIGKKQLLEKYKFRLSLFKLEK